MFYRGKNLSGYCLKSFASMKRDSQSGKTDRICKTIKNLIRFTIFDKKQVDLFAHWSE